MAGQASEASTCDRDAFNRYEAIRVVPLPGLLGARVECGDLLALDERARAEVRRAWLDHLVLLFRGQVLDDEQLMQVGGYFGPLEKAPPPPVNSVERRAHPYISVISNVIENGVAIGSLGNDEAIWHSDMSNEPVPPAGSILTALEVPPHGGETGFINMYHALETLPRELREAIEGRTIYHDGSRNSAGVKRRIAVSASHPIVRTHPETRRNALYLGRRRDARIDGLEADASDRLLDALWAHATRDGVSWHHAWSVGDTIVWDNRCAIHHRNSFEGGLRRVMHRTQTTGTVPACLPDAAAGHPRAALAARAASR